MEKAKTAWGDVSKWTASQVSEVKRFIGMFCFNGKGKNI